MKLREPEKWEDFVKTNTLPAGDDGADYSLCILRFTEQWADEMEKRLAAGGTVADHAKAAASVVNRRPDMEGGITGFMYGCAVAMLSVVWEHGEELRRWHNLDVQYGKEGEEANERGAVLNPAIIRIGK